MEVDIYERNYWYCKCRRLIEVFTLFKRLPVQKDALFKTLKLYTLFKTQDLETKPCSAAHTCIGQIRECPPGHLITLVGHDLFRSCYTLLVFNSTHACENITSIRMGAHRDLLDRVYHMLNVCLCAF